MLLMQLLCTVSDLFIFHCDLVGLLHIIYRSMCEEPPMKSDPNSFCENHEMLPLTTMIQHSLTMQKKTMVCGIYHPR